MKKLLLTFTVVILSLTAYSQKYTTALAASATNYCNNGICTDTKHGKYFVRLGYPTSDKLQIDHILDGKVYQYKEVDDDFTILTDEDGDTYIEKYYYHGTTSGKVTMRYWCMNKSKMTITFENNAVLTYWYDQKY